MAPSNRTEEPSREEVKQRIRAAGLRATPGRIATYQVLLAAASPLTHGDVVEQLGGPCSSTGGFDRATVYRNLMDLTEAGLVARSDLGDRVWRFELSTAADPGDHVHFVCVECGDVRCLPEVDVSIAARARLPRAVTAREVEVQLRGRCDGCSRSAPSHGL